MSAVTAATASLSSTLSRMSSQVGLASNQRRTASIFAASSRAPFSGRSSRKAPTRAARLAFSAAALSARTNKRAEYSASCFHAYSTASRDLPMPPSPCSARTSTPAPLAAASAEWSASSCLSRPLNRSPSEMNGRLRGWRAAATPSRAALFNAGITADCRICIVRPSPLTNGSPGNRSIDFNRLRWSSCAFFVSAVGANFGPRAAVSLGITMSIVLRRNSASHASHCV
jgi:hypothetical protein